MKNKFTIEKDYNITIIAEGIDVNKAEVQFCLLLNDFNISLPLKNIKENVFRLRIPNKIKDTIKNNKEINYVINVKDENLIFEVAKSKFTLEFFAVKEVKIQEAEESEEEVENIIIEHKVKIEESPEVIPEKKEPLNKKAQVKQLIENIVNKNKA